MTFGVYRHYQNSQPVYFDAPQDFEKSEFDENNALKILQQMDEEGLNFDE